jgi:hypothetical protein
MLKTVAIERLMSKPQRERERAIVRVTNKHNKEADQCFFFFPQTLLRPCCVAFCPFERERDTERQREICLHVFSSSLKDPLLHLDLVEHGTTTTTTVIIEITKPFSVAETAAKKRLHCRAENGVPGSITHKLALVL